MLFRSNNQQLFCFIHSIYQGHKSILNSRKNLHEKCLRNEHNQSSPRVRQNSEIDILRCACVTALTTE